MEAINTNSSTLNSENTTISYPQISPEKSEFIANIPLLNHRSKLIIHKEEGKCLFITKVYPQKTDEPLIKMFVTLKDKIFHKELDYYRFSDLKYNLGIEAKWSVFLRTFANAMESLEGGDVKLYYNNDLNSLTLTIIHPLGENVKVNSKLCFEHCYDKKKDFDMYSRVYRELLIDLYEAKEEFKNKVNLQFFEKKIENLGNINNNNNVNNNLNLYTNLTEEEQIAYIRNSNNNKKNNYELKSNNKRKYKSNLLIPGFKKRTGKKGVSYGFTEQEEDE